MQRSHDDRSVVEREVTSICGARGEFSFASPRHRVPVKETHPSCQTPSGISQGPRPIALVTEQSSYSTVCTCVAGKKEGTGARSAEAHDTRPNRDIVQKQPACAHAICTVGIIPVDVSWRITSSMTLVGRSVHQGTPGTLSVGEAFTTQQAPMPLEIQRNSNTAIRGHGDNLVCLLQRHLHRH